MRSLKRFAAGMRGPAREAVLRRAAKYTAAPPAQPLPIVRPAVPSMAMAAPAVPSGMSALWLKMTTSSQQRHQSC
jgi:hypothetical protein